MSLKNINRKTFLYKRLGKSVIECKREDKDPSLQVCTVSYDVNGVLTPNKMVAVRINHFTKKAFIDGTPYGFNVSENKKGYQWIEPKELEGIRKIIKLEGFTFVGED